MKKSLALLAPLVALVLSSCAGYHVGSNKPAHLAHITKIAVPIFENMTLEPRLSVMATNALIKELQNDGSYQIVKKEDADAILECSIRTIDRSQFRAVHNVLRTRELRVDLKTDYKLKDPSGTVLHSGRIYRGSYIVLDPNFQLSEHQAMEETVQRTAAALVSEIADGW